MSWGEIRLVYLKELRSAFRERSIVVNSVLLPVFLYPFILWLMFTGITFVTGLSEGFVSRVALHDLPAAHQALRDTLEAMESVELEEVPTPEESTERIQAGDLDAALEFLPAPADGIEDNVRIRLSYHRSEERSSRARTRLEGVLDRYRERLLEEEAGQLELTREELEQYRVITVNVATGREMGAFLLAEMVPLFLVIMVALGCLVPAVDATAGERERSTWETTMTLAVSRSSIVTAKYLYVATLGMLAGALNVIAVTITLGPIFRPILERTGESMSFVLPPSALPIMILGAGILALFFAAAMMILASFARTFKDGQSMVTPVYWLALLPLLLGNTGEETLTPAMAAIPVANVAGMMRDAIMGSYQPLLILETLAVGLAMVVVCLWFARWVLRFEDHLMGSYDGSFWRFVRERLLGKEEMAA